MNLSSIIKYLWLLIFSLYITACSDTPSKQQFQDAIQQSVFNEEYQSIFLIRDAKKVNGYTLDNFYYAEMEYQRLCLVAIDDAIAMLDQDVQQSSSNNVFDELAKGLYSLASQSGLLKATLVERYGRFEKGDVILEKITLKFLKTEQGWRFYDN